MEAADHWITGRLRPRALSSDASINAMWDELSTLAGRKAEARQKEKAKEENWREFRLSRPEERRLGDLKAATKKFQDKLAEGDNPRVKTIEQMQEIRAEAIRIARRVMDKRK